MSTFSRRNGYNTRDIQLECAGKELKQRIWARFYKQEFNRYDTMNWKNYTTGIEDMMIEMGLSYQFPTDVIIKEMNAVELRDYIIKSDKWYCIYDFIERYLRICDGEKESLMRNEFNRILQDEAAAYRIVEKQVVPITNESELATIDEAMGTEYDSVNTHIAKALELYADRKSPDYENSIKESISAVEAICSIITGETGKNGTLGNTITKLKNKGVHIHPAMEKAYSALYGYTNDESGIRHGSMDFNNAPAEDAKYMLVSCSAFVNYLTEKWSKVSSN